MRRPLHACWKRGFRDWLSVPGPRRIPTGLVASVVASPIGLSALRGGASLDKATEKIRTAGLDPRVRLVNRLRTGHNALAEALNDLADYADDEEVIRLVEDIEGVVNSITETVEEFRN